MHALGRSHRDEADARPFSARAVGCRGPRFPGFAGKIASARSRSATTSWCALGPPLDGETYARGGAVDPRRRDAVLLSPEEEIAAARRHHSAAATAEVSDQIAVPCCGWPMQRFCRVAANG